MPNPWTGKGNPYTRKEVVARLRATLKRGDAIIAAGAGTGISAKFIEKGGADLIIIYNSGRFRMMGHGSTCGLMSYGDANAIAMEIGEYEVLPVGGSIGVKQAVVTWDFTLKRIQEIIDAARRVRKDIFFLAHGGPINTPADADRVMQNTDAVGFVGASSLERMGVEASLTNLTREFKKLQAPAARTFGKARKK